MASFIRFEHYTGPKDPKEEQIGDSGSLQDTQPGASEMSPQSSLAPAPEDVNASDLSWVSTTAAASSSQTYQLGQRRVNRGKRSPYKTATPIQLELLVNGHFNESLSVSAAARRAGIARSTAATLLKKYKANNGIIPQRKHRGRTAPPTLLDVHTVWIDSYLAVHHDATLENIRQALLREFPSVPSISISALQRHISLKCTNSLKRSRRGSR
ncbi:hypothetical protein BC940DRAFT_298492 [Gongronella butleri]|nr:hypothetical protein BC940DRAFT_298492 [Gongronella butleri]